MAPGVKRSIKEIVSELSALPRKVQARSCHHWDALAEDCSTDGSPSDWRHDLERDLADLKLSSPTKEFVFEDDPQWVAEYASDIFSKLGRDEEEIYLFSDYMKDQPELGPEERAIAVDWLVEVQVKYKLKAETLFLAVGLLDAFLALKEVRRDDLQLLVVAALFVAAKFEEMDPPELRDFVHLTEQACSKQDILSMEAKLLTAVEFRICRPTASHFLDRYLQSSGCDENQRDVLEYVLLLALVDFEMLRFTPSEQVAAAALICARLFCDPGFDLGLPRSDSPERQQRVAQCVVEMCRLLQDAATAPLQAVRRKFLRPENGLVAALIRDFDASEVASEDGRSQLPDELPSV